MLLCTRYNEREVIAPRRADCVRLHHGEDAIDDSARTLVAGLAHHIQQALLAELAIEAVARVAEAVCEKDEQVIVGTPGLLRLRWPARLHA